MKTVNASVVNTEELSFWDKIDQKLAEMNIKPAKWSAWVERVTVYWKDFWHNTPGFVAKTCKLVHDTWDYVSYNACSFMGSLFCALVLF